MADWNDFTMALAGSYPATRFDPDQLVMYVNELQARGASPNLALQALRSQTSQFPPSAGVLGNVCQVLLQGPPPAWMTAYNIISRHVTKLDYYRPATTFDAFIEAVAGEHEAVGRFALAFGPVGIRELPDPRLPQDTSGSVALTAAERQYGQVMRDWVADPRPGVALEEARRVAIAAGGEGMQDVIEGLRPAAQLERAPDD